MNKIILITGNKKIITDIRKSFSEKFQIVILKSPFDIKNTERSNVKCFIYDTDILPDLIRVAIRKYRKQILFPIVLLTKHNSPSFLARTERNMVDDYVFFPTSRKELSIRISDAISNYEGIQIFKDIMIMDHKVKNNHAEIDLSDNEYNCLKFLALHCEEIVSKATLAELLWQNNNPDKEHGVTVLIAKLRKKISSITKKNYIITHPKKGYSFSDK